MKYTVILEPAEEGGYIVTVPAFPAIVTQGESVKEALANAGEAIELELEVLIEHGEQVPEDHTVQIEQIEIAQPII